MSLTLNSAELEFQEATITQDNKTQPAKWNFAPEKEQVTLTVADALEPGSATIHIKYTGVLNDKLRGFYLARTKERNYATRNLNRRTRAALFPPWTNPPTRPHSTLR